MIKLFKLFETRTAGLSESEFEELLHKNCRDFVNNPKLLQRNKERNDGEFTFINPAINIRNTYKDPEGAGVSSEHNSLFMDNLPSWKGFPKRSKSIIGLTGEDARSLFGKFRYLVIPYDNATFGVAPSMDLWSCRALFKEGSPGVAFDDGLSRSLASKKLSHPVSDESYEQMMSDITQLYNNWLSKGLEGALFRGVVEQIFEYISENNLSITDAFNDILAPEKFKGTHLDKIQGYKKMNYSQLTSLGPDEYYEFWTESNCLLFRLENIPQAGSLEHIKKQVVEEYKKFCKYYL